jgi:hypothetical protein
VTSPAAKVLEAVVGVALLAAVTWVLHEMYSREKAGRQRLEPWFATLVTVVPGLIVVTLLLAAAGLANQPIAFLFLGLMITAGLAVVARVGPLRNVRGGAPTSADGTVSGAPRVRWARVLPVAALPVVLAVVASVVAYRSDATRGQAVTAMAVTRTTTGVVATVYRGANDHRRLGIRVVQGALRVWPPQAPYEVLPDAATTKVELTISAVAVNAGAEVEVVDGSTLVLSAGAAG